MRFLATLLALVLTYNISPAQNFFETPPPFNTFTVKKEVFSKTALDKNKFCVLYLDKDAPKFKILTFSVTVAEFKKVIDHNYDSKDEILIFKNRGGALTTVSVKGKSESEIVKFYKELYGDSTPKKAVVGGTDKVVVVSTSWCFWCRKLEKEVLPSLRNIVIVEEVDNENTSTPFGVGSYPTIIYFKNGKEAWRVSGYLTFDQIKAKIGATTSSLKVADKEYHVHKCSKGHEWSHSHLSKGNITDHLCPTCGELVWEIYETSKRIIKG